MTPHRAKDRFLAWLVTGPLGRGGVFAYDFSTALARGLRGLARRKRADD